MSHFDVSVNVLEEFGGLVQDGWLTQIVEAALSAESQRAGSKMSVVIAGDDVVRTLNRLHRGLDEITDVLSFSFTHEGEYYGEREAAPEADLALEFAVPPGEEPGLGEVIISYPQAHRQAEQAGHSVERELAALLTHGVLHLLGHDHEDSEEQAAMKRAETRALAGTHNRE
jgi:probable rRNA maturation factor